MRSLGGSGCRPAPRRWWFRVCCAAWAPPGGATAGCPGRRWWRRPFIWPGMVARWVSPPPAGWPWRGNGSLPGSTPEAAMTCRPMGPPSQGLHDLPRSRDHAGGNGIPGFTCPLHQGVIAHGQHRTDRCSGWTEDLHRQRGWAPEVAWADAHLRQISTFLQWRNRRGAEEGVRAHPCTPRMLPWLLAALSTTCSTTGPSRPGIAG